MTERRRLEKLDMVYTSTLKTRLTETEMMSWFSSSLNQC